ncbi:Hypothetical protein EUBELI_20424 (plasmid) [Lachnospira eligens ATCC 27750]|uniref:Secreted protein n=1 Tax=Lachnospira eligens (strain ATCC 27750 / DSM 3376 / VPI C15-48 / C15-B4) TaxID=515620 RepID=C4Z6H7_LACE2|nr:Hypothetical protein EUBELI_20424 [[Eubacterium] eligens ATCC 27750]
MVLQFNIFCCMLLISAVQLAEDALWALWDNPQGVQFILKKPTAWATLSYKLRSQMVGFFARVAMRIGVKIHNHACMDWGFFTDIRGAPRQCQNEILASSLLAKKNHEERTQSSHLTGGQL